MVNFGDEFQLSRWFNSSVSSSSSSAHATDSEDGDAAGSADDAVAPSSSANLAECFICHMPNPEYMSTNTAKKAPPVPVCSVGCEAKYLEMKGMRPSNDARNADPNHCFMCQAPNPEYSVSTRGVATPVCSKECEEAFLRRKKQRVNSDGDGGTSAKRSKGESSEPAKRQRRTLNFLGDQLLDSSDGKGYKSWWLGALTFYDFVYQRHGMWHSYSISNDVPRVDQCLIKFGKCSVQLGFPVQIVTGFLVVVVLSNVHFSNLQHLSRARPQHSVPPEACASMAAIPPRTAGSARSSVAGGDFQVLQQTGNFSQAQGNSQLGRFPPL